ncbi:tetratricopeptide repeat protein [Caulobacter sp. NIBR2454]|uniref:tetratricopeptide repeat protein n=1 Tax=Caulobacter sp. NIBR2454 TaxID=3015996 RepID=UPI0022B620DF|nr:tetratricopeptide repeat protein [Caulobacter sp. NIBR2454]
MTLKDHRGLAVTGASPFALERFESALALYNRFGLDPVAELDAALADSPDFIMAHVLRAHLHLSGTDPMGVTAILPNLAQAEGAKGTPRETAHVLAIRAMVEGRWREAARTLEDIAVTYPLDMVAVRGGHFVDFLLGDSRMLRDRIARAMPAWGATTPGWHAMLAMHAFGLEETGDYARAEQQGLAALKIEPRDSWAKHAVAHVLEMQGRAEEGVRFMTADTPAWAENNLLAVHNWWHLALYHLELGDYEQVLRLFDGPIHGARSPIVFDLVDASAMLWRLQLLGVDVGDRWTTVADGWSFSAADSAYAFNDMHAMMAFAAANRKEDVRLVRAVQSSARETVGDNREFLNEVGHAATEAMAAFAAGDYRNAVSLLRPIRHRAYRFGGSHAQRDIIDLTLLEAAIRGGDRDLARALAAERAAAKPHGSAVLLANRAALAA